MRHNYSLFGINVTIEREAAYSVCVSSCRDGDAHGVQSWYTAATYLGAIHLGWRLARMFAAVEGVDNHYAIWRGVEPTKGEKPLRIKTIQVVKVVKFFSV